MGEGRGNSFYQTLMDKDREGDGLGDSNGAKRRMEEGLEKQTGKSELEAGRTEGAKDSERDKEMNKNSSLPARESDMIIHVFDDQRKSKLVPQSTQTIITVETVLGKRVVIRDVSSFQSFHFTVQLRDSSTVRELCW